MVSDKILKLAKTLDFKLNGVTKSKINQALSKAGLDGNFYFEKAEHGLQRAVIILSDFGMEQDGIENSHLFTQKEGRMTLDLAVSNSEDPFSPTPISNSVLALSFHQMGSGRFEVLAYLS